MKVCNSYCEQDGDFIEKYASPNGITRNCCYVCPAFEKCKELDNGIGCRGVYDSESCINCEFCSEE